MCGFAGLGLDLTDPVLVALPFHGLLLCLPLLLEYLFGLNLVRGHFLLLVQDLGTQPSLAVADKLVVGSSQIVGLHLEGLELELGGPQRLGVRGPGGLKGDGGLLDCLSAL
jgi:hypothetical protein